MGSVFEVERVADGTRLALKRVEREFARDDVAVQRFAREVRAARAVHSEHIVRVLDVGTDDGAPFFVMDRLEGEDLGARLRRDTRLPPDVAVTMACQVLEGLRHAHARGVIHRDLKPDNIFLARTTGDASADFCVKILDFGMSKVQPLGATRPLALTLKGVAVGTPLYMSPEQAAARPDVDARSDIYSVGAILFECLTGRPPHVGETDEALLAAIRTTPAPSVSRLAPAIDAPLAVVIDRALVFDSRARFASAGEMQRALEATRSPRAGGRQGLRLALRLDTSWQVGAAALLALSLGVVVTVVTVLLLRR